MCSEKCLPIHIFSNKEKKNGCHALSTHSMWQTHLKINFLWRSKYYENIIFINMKLTFFNFKSRVLISLATMNKFFCYLCLWALIKGKCRYRLSTPENTVGTFLNIKKTTQIFFILTTPFLRLPEDFSAACSCANCFDISKLLCYCCLIFFFCFKFFLLFPYLFLTDYSPLP